MSERMMDDVVEVEGPPPIQMHADFDDSVEGVTEAGDPVPSVDGSENVVWAGI